MRPAGTGLRSRGQVALETTVFQGLLTELPYTPLYTGVLFWEKTGKLRGVTVHIGNQN